MKEASGNMGRECQEAMCSAELREEGEQKRVLAVVLHPIGGIRTHILYTYPLLMKAGYSFTFVVPDIAESRVFCREVAAWDGAEIVEAPMVGRHRQHCWLVPTVRRILARQECLASRDRQECLASSRERFALIHSHGIQAAVQVVAANTGFRLPHVATSHDVFYQFTISPVLGRLKMLVLGQVLRRVHSLVAVSDDAREDHLARLPALNKGPCRVVTIHNGIDLRRFTHSNGVPSNLRQQLGLNPDVVLMGFLGRFMEQKGFLVLADALAELNQYPPARPFHLVAVGSGDLLVNYQNMLDGKPDVLRRISFLPQTPDPASVLRELDLLVMPSLWEAHPLLPMEAMLVGVPIVGTSCLGLREVLRGSPSMMVPPGDAKALARALRQAISAPWKDAAMDYAAKAKDRFDVRHTADRLLSLFEHVGTRTHTRPRRD